MSFSRIGIAGVGLIGGSIGLAARATGAAITGYDRDPATLKRARARGAIDRSTSSLAGLARDTDLLVIALPLPATLAALHELGELAAPIINVASVKVPVVEAARALPHFVGTHPMAGRERGGIDAADGALFRDATWAIDAGAPAATARRVAAFVGSLGAKAVTIGAHEHDRLVASTSHLPQSLAVALGTHLAAVVAQDDRARELCGPGIRSMLRLARSPLDIWEPILRANARPLAGELHALARLLEAAALGLDQGDISPLASYFGDAARIAGVLDP